jgi:exopolysaccharide biosynthesis protein
MVAGRVASCSPPPIVQHGELLLPAAFLTDRLGLQLAAGSEAGTWKIWAYGRALRVVKDSAKYWAQDRPLQGPCAAKVISGRLYVPLEMVARTFGIQWSWRSGNVYEIAPPAATVREVRQGQYDEYLRIVLDLSGPAVYWQRSESGQVVLELPPPEPRPSDWGSLRLLSFADPLQPKVKMATGDGGWLRITITHGGRQPSRIFTLGSPARLVVDLPRATPLNAPSVTVATKPPALQTITPTTPASSTTWELRSFTTPRGPVRVWVLKATPTAVRPVLAGETLMCRARVSVLAQREGARAAVNGGYFDWPGPALGLLVIDGEWIKHPMLTRCALGITRDGRALMGRVTFDGRVDVAGAGKFTLEGLNTGHIGSDSVVVYTRRWGLEVPAMPGCVRAVVSEDGRLERVVTDGGPVGLSGRQKVISARGQAALALRSGRVGGPVEVNVDTCPSWPGIKHALGAGPQLVRDGQLAVTASEEHFRGDVTRISSRPAVGIGGDGNLILAAAEGSTANGVSCTEMAEIMLRLGCRQAMALDGGGSTTVVANGLVLNAPQDGSERPVSNALLVFGG